MKAVILAAGVGRRIHPVTNGLPKCLLPFGGQAILDFQVDSLVQAGITEVAIVVGHGKEHIVDHIARRHPGKWDSITFITNPRFAVTNNIYSLWLAREWVGASDFVCLNADVLYHPQIIVPAVATQADISVIIDREWRNETMKVIIQAGQVLAMSKAISRQDFSGIYIGITTFSQPVCRPLFAAIEALIGEGRVQEFFNVAVEQLIASGTRVSFTETAGLPWAEVDDANDLRFARSVIHPRLLQQIGAVEGQTIPHQDRATVAPALV